MRLPRDVRPAEDVALDEMPMARAWLTNLRSWAEYKLDGLDDAQLRWKPAPGANSLGTIVRHLGLAERLWFRAVWAGEPMDMAWRATMFDQIPDGWSVADVVAFYRDECVAVDAALDTATSFDEVSRASFRPTTLRWAMVHMIEETARHLGHMDITRELIDGGAAGE
jgi:hypothetical protein